MHEVDNSIGERQQHLDIYLNIIDKFQVPTEPPAAEIVVVEKTTPKREHAEKHSGGMKAQEQEQAAKRKGA